VFEPRANAGRIWELNPSERILPAVAVGVGRAGEGKSMLIKHLPNDERAGDPRLGQSSRRGLLCGVSAPAGGQAGWVDVGGAGPSANRTDLPGDGLGGETALRVHWQKRSVEALDASRKEAEIQIQKLAAFPR